MTAILSLTAFGLAVLAIASLANAGSWTKWYDRDNPTATGDWERRKDMKPVPCGGKTPLYIEVSQQQFLAWRTILRTDNYIHVGPKYGLVCINKENTWSGKPYPQCRDFLTRYSRKIFIFWKKLGWYDRDQPTATGDFELANLQSKYWASKGRVVENKTKPYSSWYDRDQPTAIGDFELANLQSKYWASKGRVVEYKTKPYSGIETYGKYLDRKIHVGAKYGLLCDNAENKKLGLPSCRDYRVRFYCK